MQFSFKRAVEKIVDDAVDQTGSISMRAQQLFEKLFHAFQRKENQFFFSRASQVNKRSIRIFHEISLSDFGD